MDKQQKYLRTKEMFSILCLSCILVSPFGCKECLPVQKVTNVYSIEGWLFDNRQHTRVIFIPCVVRTLWTLINLTFGQLILSECTLCCTLTPVHLGQGYSIQSSPSGPKAPQPPSASFPGGVATFG